MRKTAKLAVAIALILGVTVLLSGTVMAQTSDALVRFVHALPGAGAVDVYVDAAPAVRSLAFGEATTYLRMPAGTQHIVTTQAGATTPLWEQDFAPTAGQAYTLIVSSTSPLTYAAFPDDLNALPLGSSRITAVHAIADAPAVDVVLADGRAVVAGLNYNQPYGTLDIPALSYELGVVPTGASVADALIAPMPFALNGGTSYALVAYGTAANPQALALSAPTNADAGASGYVRFAHGVPGGPAVDIYANDTLVVPALSEGAATDYIAVPEGDYAISLRAAGTSEPIADTSLSVGAEERITAAALLDGEAVIVQPFVDDTAAVDQLTAGFNVINGVLGASPVNLTLQGADGTTLTEAIAGGTEETAALAATEDSPTLIVNYGGSTSDDFALDTSVIYGGAYYTVLAVSAESGIELIEFPPVSLAQTVGSAPGTSLPTAVAVEPTAVVVEQPTAEPQIVEAVTPEPQVVQPTLPPATTAPSGPTARIILDPGANLQLRQYPDRDAFSLGLAPSGTVLAVNGRVGAPAFLPDVATPTLAPEATEYVDPVTLLGEDEDLVAADTWLNVDYITPDGGVINAWVNAQFLDLRDPRGLRQRLADLPTVPSNQAGEARDTAVTPPPLPENIVEAIVVGLDAGVNLQIRRTPDTSGESLALVPNDTALELLGVNETREWAYIRYVQPEGGIVRGWVSTRFLRYSFRDRSIDYDEMEQRELLNIIPDEQRGDMSSGAAGPVAPTQNPLRNVVVGTIALNEGANLHLRRNPNSNSESLVLMPNGTQLIVSGRTDTSEWVQVEFEGQVGWTSSQYLVYTFNGAPYELADIPVTATLDITATATPEGTPSS
ncbi:MAG: DUF4397 domain-containing protein [Anaerolineae bacterium]|nr:DUF4397 domain-containing protein [Anaerolineae bacterium]